MARLLVGLPALRGKLERYAKRYDLVEVRPVDTPLPSGTKLGRWRERVPPAFAFSVVLPRVVCELAPGAELDRALRRSLEAARYLQASCLLLATPPSVRPTKRNRGRLAALRERLPADGHVVAWQATGVWEQEEAMEVAATTGWLPVFDAAEEPLAPGPVVYTRISALGRAGRLGADRAAHVARRLAGRRDAYVVVDQAVAGRLRTALRAEASQAPAGRPIPPLFRPAPLAHYDSNDEEH